MRCSFFGEYGATVAWPRDRLSVSKPQHALTKVCPDRVACRGIDQQHPKEVRIVREPGDQLHYRLPELLSCRQSAFAWTSTTSPFWHSTRKSSPGPPLSAQ